MIHIRGSDLRSVIRPSLALATVGVLIATAVTGLILWQIIGLSPYVSFLFAALIVFFIACVFHTLDFYRVRALNVCEVHTKEPGFCD